MSKFLKRVINAERFLTNGRFINIIVDKYCTLNFIFSNDVSFLVKYFLNQKYINKNFNSLNCRFCKPYKTNYDWRKIVFH